MYRTLSLAALVALSSSAMAVTITQTRSFSEVPNTSGTYTFDKFDTSLGTLNSITVNASLTSDGGLLRVDNDSDSPASGTLTVGSSLTLSSPVRLVNSSGALLFPNALLAAQTSAVSLAADDNDGTGVQNGGGDYAFLANTTSISSGGGNVGSAYFGDYSVAGAGTFGIAYNAAQELSWGQVSGIAGEFEPTVASGEITVVYDYTPVPEPMAFGSAAVAGCMVLSSRWRGRRRSCGK